MARKHPALRQLLEKIVQCQPFQLVFDTLAPLRWCALSLLLERLPFAHHRVARG